MSRRSPLARIRHLIEVMHIDAINLRDDEAASARSPNVEGRAERLDASRQRFMASLEAMEDEAARLKQQLFAYVYSSSTSRDKEMRAVAKEVVNARTAALIRHREIADERGRKRTH